MNVIETLLQRNERFAADRFNHDLRLMPSLKTMIVGCVDPRVDPVDVLGLALGEAAVIRNVGGRITPATLQTMAMLGVVSKSNGGQLGPGWNLVILQHTDCGIRCLVDSPDLLAAYFGVPASHLDALAIADPSASTEIDIASLKANQGVPGGFLVTGLVYDVATGLVSVTVPTALLRQDGVTTPAST